MRPRSIVLSVILVFLVIAAVSCNTRWDTTWAISFPEAFRGDWAAEDGTQLKITESRFTISKTGQSPITNEGEYRSKFDWIEMEPEPTSTLVSIQPYFAPDVKVDRIDTFTINEDNTLSVEFGGENPRSFGPFSRVVSAD